MSTHNIPFSIQNRKITLNYPKSAAMGFTTVVDEPSVFEPLKFYCILYHLISLLCILRNISC